MNPCEVTVHAQKKKKKKKEEENADVRKRAIQTVPLINHKWPYFSWFNGNLETKLSRLILYRLKIVSFNDAYGVLGLWCHFELDGVNVPKLFCS